MLPFSIDLSACCFRKGGSRRRRECRADFVNECPSSPKRFGSRGRPDKLGRPYSQGRQVRTDGGTRRRLLWRKSSSQAPSVSLRYRHAPPVVPRQNKWFRALSTVSVSA
jgi:hypothetical protein